MAKYENDNFDIEFGTDKAEKAQPEEEFAQTKEEQAQEEQAQEEQAQEEQAEEENEQKQDTDTETDNSENDYLDTEDFEFQPIDVSEPRAPVREMDVIGEALAIRRRDWIKTHINYIYAVIGVVIVGLIVFGIYMYFQSTNPMSRFIGSMSKNFSKSFDYEIEVTEDGRAEMSFDGAIILDRSKHDIQALYEADYNSYAYTGAVYSHDKTAVKGSFFNDKWTTHDCSESAQDFFEFDRAFRSGGFDGGAFLRFTGLTSDYSTRELNVMVDTLKKRLSTNSSIATITTEKVDSGTRFNYDINVYELFSLIKEDGASVFYRASDYDKFVAMFEENKSTIEGTKCNFNFVVDPSGYMSSFELTVTAEGHSYGLSCRMSNFAKAEVELPEEFLRAAQVTVE